MSRMTKFLKQTCQLSLATRDSGGLVVLNTYGDIQYETAVTKKCRREGYFQDVQTANGAIVRSSTRYFLDESTVVHADDMIDGHVVLSVAEYTNQLGQCEGYECYV